MRTQTSQESEINALEEMSKYIPSKRRTAICTIDGNGAVPHDIVRSPHIQWVIIDPAFGTYMLDRQTRTDRVRQEATITMWQYEPDTIVGSTNRVPTRSIPKTYSVRNGDTLPKIAAYFYGDQSKWHDI